jgi:hypothetical protein
LLYDVKSSCFKLRAFRHCGLVPQSGDFKSSKFELFTNLKTGKFSKIESLRSPDCGIRRNDGSLGFFYEFPTIYSIQQISHFFDEQKPLNA